MKFTIPIWLYFTACITCVVMGFFSGREYQRKQDFPPNGPVMVFQFSTNAQLTDLKTITVPIAVKQ